MKLKLDEVFYVSRGTLLFPVIGAVVKGEVNALSVVDLTDGLGETVTEFRPRPRLKKTYNLMKEKLS